MGANAQTAVPSFVAGEILTAAEMTQVNTGIPVFATTTTRDAAFGGTGEKTLAEGQFAYIEATDTTQYYNGSAWTEIGGGQYTSFTPTLTNITLGNGNLTTAYAQIGKFVHWVGTITFGSTTSITTNPITTLPVSSNMVFTNNMGTGMCNDSNTSFYPIAIFSISSTTAQFVCQDVATFVRTNFIGTGQPFTWATNDLLMWNMYYRAA
jgi:hypothetical protein